MDGCGTLIVGDEYDIAMIAIYQMLNVCMNLKLLDKIVDTDSMEELEAYNISNENLEKLDDKLIISLGNYNDLESKLTGKETRKVDNQFTFYFDKNNEKHIVEWDVPTEQVKLIGGQLKEICDLAEDLLTIMK